MAQPIGKVPKPPQRRNEQPESDSVRTVSIRAPPGVIAKKPQNSEDRKRKAGAKAKADKKKDEEKKPGFADWTDKVTAKGAEIASNAMAGAATLNAAVVAGGEKMLERLVDDSSDDEDDVESSDEETEDAWNSTADSAISNTPSATAVAIRNQPAVNFLNVEEEERIKAELKDAKNLRKKLRKMKKLMKKSVKGVRSFSEANENALAALHAATDDKCTDPTITELAAAAETRMQEVKQSNALSNYTTNITDQILEQIKPINDHAKMISVTGKERRAARDRRIRLVLEDVDVADEEAYSKSVDLARDFEEKDRTYKDEFVNFREHSSSQLGQMLRCYLLETATYLEAVAKAMREAAGGTTNNYYLNNDCCAKFKDFKVDSKYLSPIPPLYSLLNPERDNDDRLTAKPHSQSAMLPHPPGENHAPAVAGIPMTETGDKAAAATEQQQSTYGSSSYSRAKDNTRVRRGIDDFLLTGQLPTSDTNRTSPQLLPGRSPNLEGAQEKINGPLTSSENPRARPTSAFGTSSTNKSLMNYIYSLADEYGIEPDFPVERADELANNEEAKRAIKDNSGEDKVEDKDEEHASRPPSVVSRAKSATPDGSVILPSLHGSGRVSAPTAVSVAAMDEM
ncbi:hypothetical protein ABB37_02701 [Leptomonas pyrrhocoris]|uniref:BAR domain-containing protein n=1 Tax=Leptomonas pyrrhocoris TaxID=157538 RepID=A0A0M9G627_LEPPY|nr:hypothetical protein ABB37_02701 [Leptomonas pyrrhocoris]KPA82956.1 hypothetical protein ABB37_02701 [Leptomonas pyrrhocoris]|eukprot:XP_015661395.1 hypothetical protein ABB37_02701 [Leptomonas pyrrhocoris]